MRLVGVRDVEEQPEGLFGALHDAVEGPGAVPHFRHAWDRQSSN